VTLAMGDGGNTFKHGDYLDISINPKKSMEENSPQLT
jgi:hypothetical protein